MKYLLLSVLLHVGIFSMFRLFPRLRIHTFQAIVANYYVCIITGTLFVRNTRAFEVFGSGEVWPWLGVILGFVFVNTFHLMARTAQLFSITVSSVASKISMAIPVGFALFVFELQSKHFDAWNYLGLSLSIVAIFLLSSGQPSNTRSRQSGLGLIVLPALVFLFNGTIDTVLNYANYKYLSPSDEAIFPIVAFLSAAFFGTLALGYQKVKLDRRSLVAGAILGIINYFSIFYLIRGLSEFDNDGALFFPIFNVGIIVGSTLVSVIVFGEKMKLLRILGLVTALISIIFIAYQELLSLTS